MLTKRDRAIVDMLVGKTRLATLHQVIAAWWGTSKSAERNGRRRIRFLCDAGWLDEARVLARPLLDLAEPLTVWQPGDETPNFHQLAWRTQGRWLSPARRVAVLAASRRARHRFGGSEHRPLRNVCQFTHDLHVTAIYLHLLQIRPDVAALWRGEDTIPSKHRNRIRPDALFMDSQGHALRAVEFGGRYAADRLRHFHEGCVAKNLPYEVW